MQTLFLEKNPFYILEASPSEKRAAILAKAEEKAFFAENDSCEEAQAALTNPQKRLSAELDWFFDIPAEKQSEIIQSIKNRSKINADGLSGISRLNAAIYNFVISEYADHFEIGYAILDLDGQYESISPAGLCGLINEYRTKSGMPLPSQADVLEGFNKKRSLIRQAVSEKLEGLHEEGYIELVAMIAETCIADDHYDDGIVISDVIDQYEIRMQSKINDKADKILNAVENTGSFDSDSTINLIIDHLIEELKDFDKYAQPLQIKSAFDGIDHNQSLKVARACREFAIKLHNGHHNIEGSLKLIQALKNIFPELTEFFEVIENDEKEIIKLKEKREQHDRDVEANRQADKRYLIETSGNEFVFPSFCTCCMKPTSKKENICYSRTTRRGNMRITRSISVDLPICDECLKHRSRYKWFLVLICSISITLGSAFMAILMAVNTDGFLSFLLGASLVVGTYYILSAVWKIKPLSKEHAARGESARIFARLHDGPTMQNMPNQHITFTFYNWEYAQLFREANADIASNIRQEIAVNTAKMALVLKATGRHLTDIVKMMGVFIVVTLTICWISGSVNSGRYSSPPSMNNTVNNAANSNTNNGINGAANNNDGDSYDDTPPSSYNSGNFVKINQLNSELEDMEDELKDMERRLKQLLDNIDYYELEYYNTGYDFYIDYYEEAVDDYNYLYAQYASAVDEYNGKVDEYNRLIGAD